MLLSLQMDAIKMVRCYLKGTITSLSGALNDAETFLAEPGRVNPDESYDILKRIEKHYSLIPFSNISADGEYAPLFEVRGILPLLRKAFDEVFQYKDEKALERIYDRIILIKKHGDTYRRNFSDLMRKIGNIPGGEKFAVFMTDINYDPWYYKVGVGFHGLKGINPAPAPSQ